MSAASRSPMVPPGPRGGRPPRRGRRTPIDTSGGPPVTGAEFSAACKIVAEVLPPLRAKLDADVGRPRSLSVKALLVALQVNGLRRHHEATVAEMARVLNSFSQDQLDALGVRDWNPAEAYDRADRLFNKLSRALDEGWDALVDGVRTHIDAHWFANRLAQASVSELPVRSKSLAVDGTDIETWGTLRGELGETDVDAVGLEAIPPAPSPWKPGAKRKARVLGIGSDGRKVYTADPDARAGHRSATNSRAAGYYVGYELHLGVQTRDVTWSDGIERVSLGPKVPPVITTLALVPAGSHRGDAMVPSLVAAKESGQDLEDVVWDRGYSQLRPETTGHLLSRAGIHQTFRPMEAQRRTKPFSADALVIEGQLFSAHLPDELHGPLPMPSIGASVEELARCELAFNQRARYRYQRHAGPDADGVTRWRCPFCSGFLRSRSLPKTMRRSRTAPLVNLPASTSCCGGTVSVSAEELPLWQLLPPGTTAWRISMGRRQVVEGANAGLKGGFVNIERKFMRVLGVTKMTVLLAFTIAGYNIDRIRAYATQAALKLSAKRTTRAKRRRGTWTDLLSDPPASSGPDPPT